MSRKLTGVLILAWAALATGCVERHMIVRSEPPGAPAWVDEQYAGLTPVEYSFAHYGWRRVRVGPVRDEQDRVLYREKQIEVDIRAPWYQLYPIDFVVEVLFPGRVRDDHLLPVIALDAEPAEPPAPSREEVGRLRKEAEEFRTRALRAIPGSATP